MCSLYERPVILIQNPFRSPKSIVKIGRENMLGLISRSLFIGGGVTYPPRDDGLISLQAPTGDGKTDCHMRALVKLAIQKFRSLANNCPRYLVITTIFHCQSILNSYIAIHMLQCYDIYRVWSSQA